MLHLYQESPRQPPISLFSGYLYDIKISITKPFKRSESNRFPAPPLWNPELQLPHRLDPPAAHQNLCKRAAKRAWQKRKPDGRGLKPSNERCLNIYCGIVARMGLGDGKTSHVAAVPFVACRKERRIALFSNISSSEGCTKS